jgi:hypothetical protein
VARPGVPQTPFAAGRSRTVPATGRRLVTGPAPDLRRLSRHVVNVGNNGRLSATGRFTSSPDQVGRIFEHMERWHSLWRERDPHVKRHIVIYAHGGLNSEAHALRVAQENVSWWLDNRVYPVFFAWQSGVAETLVDHLADSARQHLPFGLGFDWIEQADRWVELTARRTFRWMWEEMKENARAASEPLRAAEEPRAASLAVSRLRDYIRRHGPENVAVHLVGHSAGAIFLAAMLPRLAEADVRITSMAFLAPALRVDAFVDDVLPHLGPDRLVESFATFNLNDQRELDDACGANGIDIYHKSILYLVSRAFEGDTADAEVPLLGMAKFLQEPVCGEAATTLEKAIQSRNGVVVVAPTVAPYNSRCEATRHSGFAGDGPTMTSVAMRVLGLHTPRPENEYRPNAALADATVVPSPSPRPPAPTAVAVGPPGEGPLVHTAEPAGSGAAAPEHPGVRLEVAAAPASGSPVLDILLARGWQRGEVR